MDTTAWPDERMLAEVIQAAAERGLGRVHREPNQPRNSPSRSARRAGHEGGHRNGSGRSGGNRRAVAEAAGERGDRNPGGADRTGKRANRARTALATSPLTNRTSAVSLSGLVFASTMSSPRARSSATRSVRERQELTNPGLVSTARCCGRPRHRQTDSDGVCSPASRRVATLRPRFAGLATLTPAPRTPSDWLLV